VARAPPLASWQGLRGPSQSRTHSLSSDYVSGSLSIAQMVKNRLSDGKLESYARERKTREHTDDVIAQPMISPLRWVATHN
jgi:hypothetical protein